MGFLSCFATPSGDEMPRRTADYAPKKNLSDCSTQTDVPEASWLKEVCSTPSQLMPVYSLRCHKDDRTAGKAKHALYAS